MYSKTFLVSLLSTIFLVSCASYEKHPTASEHHHACSMDNCQMKHKCEMYAKKCAYSVSRGDFDVKGKEEYRLTHRGHNYFFSSKEKMEKFKKDIDKNIDSANRNWSNFDRR